MCEVYLWFKNVSKIIKLKFVLILGTFNFNYRDQVFNIRTKILEWFIIIINVFLRVFLYRIIKYWFLLDNFIQSKDAKTSDENKFRLKRLEFNF